MRVEVQARPIAVTRDQSWRPEPELDRPAVTQRPTGIGRKKRSGSPGDSLHEPLSTRVSDFLRVQVIAHSKCGRRCAARCCIVRCLPQGVRNVSMDHDSPARNDG
jgi:hypothetical protein